MSRPALLAALLLLAPAFLALAPPAQAQTFTATFRPHDGNEWWVQVAVQASEPLAKVEAQGPDGAWRGLTLRSWGSWAASIHVPDGATVRFRATATSGAVATSGGYLWPSGAPQGGSGPADGFSAEFANVGGNEWWIQASVRANQALAGVDARVDGGSWKPLEKKSWGGWAASVHAPTGSLVQLRARAASGGEALSATYRWPDATVVSGGSGGGGTDGGSGGTDGGSGGTTTFSATFRDVKGNEWWVQTDVDANAPLAGVDARVDGGSWVALEDKGWAWARSVHAPAGSHVELRARATSGATVTSGAYRWPDATPVDGGGSGDGGSADGGLRIEVDASRGPWGAGHVRIDNDLYGLNVADWNSYDYSPSPKEPFLTYLRAIKPGVLRWPAGHTSQATIWERTPDQSWGSRWLSTEHFDDFVSLAREVGADPLVAVNMKTATPKQAADMVRYANLEKGHGVRWWQLGNEPDHRDGLTSGPEEYARKAVEFAKAMKAVDPSIQLVGGEIMTGAHVMGSNGQRDWMTPILQQAGSHFDGVSWHYYPLDSGQTSSSSSAYPTVEHLFQETAWDWKPAGMSFADEVFPRLHRLRDSYAPGAGVWVTEIAEDSGKGGKEGIVGATAGMLWTADLMGRFAAHGPEAVVKFVFKSGSDHRFTLIDEKYEPRPAYYVYWLYARHFGTRIVDADSADVRSVAAHAALRDDGALTLMLVNKKGDARSVDVDLDGFAARTAQRYVVRGDWYGDTSVTINGQTLHRWNVEGSGAVAAETVSVDGALHATLPPYSVTLVVLRA